MKRFTAFKLSLSTLLVAGVLLGLGGVAKALPGCYSYGQPTGVTPVFNNICDVQQGLNSTDGVYPIGNERDFVRIRPNVNGDVTSNANNPKLQNDLTAACKAGDKFDVWTYVHNNASPDSNDNGNGTGVAKNVKLALDAKGINTTGSNFTFGSTISASNAETVSDTATLNCGGKQVKLTLVKNSVRYNNTTSAPSWQSLSDGYVNSTNAIGNPVFISGAQWGCYDYRTIVVYEVTVEELPPPAPVVTATCDMFKITGDDRTVKVSQFNYTAKNATFKKVVLNWDKNDTSAVTEVTDASKVVGQTHQYSKDGKYLVTAVVHFTTATNNDLVADTANCQQQIEFSTDQPPVVTVVTTKPRVLPNTGAGSVAGLFGAVTIAGAAAHRLFLGRRLNRG